MFSFTNHLDIKTMYFKKHSRAPLFLFLTLGFVFGFCIYRGAIYSYDTYDYLQAMPYRQLGYVIFLKSFQFVFKSYFDIAAVVFQTGFCLFAVHYFFKKIVVLFSLNLWQKIVLLAILIFPFFNPLLIANNICSEGIAYGLYLLLISFGLDIIMNLKLQQIRYFILVYLLLVFVRGQFLFTTLLFGCAYFLVYRKQIKVRKHLINLLLFISIPFLVNLGSRSYHKLKDGFFKSTPFGFVNASTSVFYTSRKSDVLAIKNETHKAVFELCYAELNSKNVLQSSKKNTKDDYLFFHENLPKICNQTILASGKAYLQSINPKTPNNLKHDVAKAYFDIEAACKDITLTLIKVNFSKWIYLYFKNISYGFYSPLILFLVIAIMMYSLIKIFRVYNKTYIILFLISTLILSNAMLVAFASHSIMRYLFYNYALLFLMCIKTLKLINVESKS